MAEKRKLTKTGYKALEDELRELIDVKLPECKKQLAESRAEGDLSENADYDAARSLQAEIEGRIKQIQEIKPKAQSYERALNSLEFMMKNDKTAPSKTQKSEQFLFCWIKPI